MKKSVIFGFIFGLIGSLLLIVVIIPNYSDYRAMSQASNWLTEFEQSETTKQIENQLLANQSVKVSTDKLKFKFVKFAKVNALGEVVLKGENYGQILILIPIKENNNIRWQCVGGSDKDIPSKCLGK